MDSATESDAASPPPPSDLCENSKNKDKNKDDIHDKTQCDATVTVVSAGSLLPVLENFDICHSADVCSIKTALCNNVPRLKNAWLTLYREDDVQFQHVLDDKDVVLEDAASTSHATLVLLTMPSWNTPCGSCGCMMDIIEWHPKRHGVFATLFTEYDYQSCPTFGVMVCDASKMRVQTDVEDPVDRYTNEANPMHPSHQTTHKEEVLTKILPRDVGFDLEATYSLTWHPDGDGRHCECLYEPFRNQGCDVFQR